MSIRELEKPRSEPPLMLIPSSCAAMVPCPGLNPEDPSVAVAPDGLFRPAGTGPACSSCLERCKADASLGGPATVATAIPPSALIHDSCCSSCVLVCVLVTLDS